MEIGTIVTRVCERYGIAADSLLEQSRRATITVARSVICYLAVRRARHSGSLVDRLVNLQRAGVTVAAGWGEKLVQDDPVLLGIINK